MFGIPDTNICFVKIKIQSQRDHFWSAEAGREEPEKWQKQIDLQPGHRNRH